MSYPQPGVIGQPPPAGPGYPPPAMGYPMPNDGYPPPGTGYPPPGAGYPPPGAGYPPTGGGYPPPGAGYPPADSGFQPVGPNQVQMTPVPAVPLNCPPGLEYLTMIDQILVHQKVELLEAFTGFETSNKYEIKNSMGQKIYSGTEDTDCCTRNCCGPARPFDLKISDNGGNEVIHFYRPLRCSTCWFPCCLQRLEVMAPPGTVIGYVQQEWSICFPKFLLQNSAGDTVLRIEGPCLTWSICGDVEFKVLSKDGSVEVGKISKQWSGLLREAFTDADHFGITFPLDLDVTMKAVVMGALFLIDFMFFEKAQNKETDRPGMF